MHIKLNEIIQGITLQDTAHQRNMTALIIISLSGYQVITATVLY